MRRIDLDHASGTPLDPRVAAAMRPYFEERFGNPSSLHHRGREAREAVDAARGRVARLLACPPDEVLFTASASEANNLALKGLSEAWERPGRVVAAATEHISILHPLRTLTRRGHEVVLLRVDRHGRVDPDELRRALQSRTAAVSVAHASSEIGTLQDLETLGAIVHAHGALFHCDATLTAGALALPSGTDAPDLVTVSPALFYGPAGIGALRVRRGVRLRPIVEGGPQEAGLRAGTESVAAIVGFGAAAELAHRERDVRGGRADAFAARLRAALLERLDGLTITGHPSRRVPGHLSVCVSGVEAEALLRGLDDLGIDAASGSACTTGAGKTSHVLQAIGVDPVLARGALLLTGGEGNRKDDPTEAGAMIATVVTRLRALSPLAGS